jgi:monothiol glutaredoxin
MTPELKERIDQLVQSHKVFVFMKGNKLMPQCGFSNNVVQILNSLGIPYGTCDVLADSDIRQGIKEYSNWPTIPQVYVNGEFIGGSDIMIELYQSGELQQMLEVALAS